MLQESVKWGDFKKIISKKLINEIETLVKKLKGKKIQMINSTKAGGGVAEILGNFLPLMKDLGLKAQWDVITGDADFFGITKAMHNALHGADQEITPAMLESFKKTAKKNYGVIDQQADFVIIHDPQPLLLIEGKKNKKSKWLWRCHVYVAQGLKLWSFLKTYVDKYDAAIFHLPEYNQGASCPVYIKPPSINPLVDKNKFLSRAQVKKIVEGLGIKMDKPIVLQVSRFDRLKDPVGVVNAFKIVREQIDCQLVLAGAGAADDPEGDSVLAEVYEHAKGVKDVHILNLVATSPTNHLEVNALQRAATVVVQKSIKEGFGLVVTEAMWKKKPIVGGNVGGIRLQIADGISGYLVNDEKEAAERIIGLLKDPQLAAKMGRAGYKIVKENFITPIHLKNLLKILVEIG